MTACMCSLFSIRMATASPSTSPAARKKCASWFARASNSAKVTTVPDGCMTMAGLSGVATAVSRICMGRTLRRPYLTGVKIPPTIPPPIPPSRRKGPSIAGIPGLLRLLAGEKLGEAGLQRVELVLDAGGQLVADELEPLLDQRQFLAPLGRVDRQRLGPVAALEFEPAQAQVLGRRHDTDRGVLTAGLVFDAVDDPLEHPAVLAEARPQEAAVFIATEPVDEEHLWQLGVVGVLAQVAPVREVVSDVVAQERQHRHRVAAHAADLALGRGGLLAAHGGAH